MPEGFQSKLQATEDLDAHLVVYRRVEIGAPHIYLLLPAKETFMKLVLFSLFAILSAKAQIPYQDVVLADKPAAYWGMGEPAGSLYAIDFSGHGDAALVQGTVFFGQTGALHDNPNTSVNLGGGPRLE